MSIRSLFLSLASISSRIKASDLSLLSLCVNSEAIGNSLFHRDIDLKLVESREFQFFADLLSTTFFSEFLIDINSLTNYFEYQIHSELKKSFTEFPSIQSYQFNTLRISTSLAEQSYHILRFNTQFLKGNSLNQAFLYCYRIAVILSNKIQELLLFLNDFDVCRDEIQKLIMPTEFLLFDGLGDPHNNARSVLKLSCTKTRQFIFYKPRFYDGEILWDSICSCLSPPAHYQSTQRTRLLASNGFFEEGVSYSQVARDRWPSLYQKFGFELFVAHLSRHTDLWFDNLICTSEGFIFIDHENIMQPISISPFRLRNQNGSERDISLDPALSVLMTMALAQPMAMSSSSMFQDMGCLSYQSNYRWPHLLNDDSMWSHPEHLPDVEGQCFPFEFIDSIKLGYTQAHSLMIKHKKNVANLLHTFKGRTRVIRRSTFDYYDIQRNLFSLQNCITGLQRWTYLVKTLSDQIHTTSYGDFSWDENLALTSEVIQLDNGDIPYFYSDFDQYNLFDSSMNAVGTFSLDIDAHLRNLDSPVYISHQLELLSLSASLHASISPSQLLVCSDNLKQQSNLTYRDESQDFALILFNRLSNYLEQFVESSTMSPVILYNFHANCLYISEPIPYSLSGIASTLDAYLSLLLLRPGFFQQSNLSTLSTAFHSLNSWLDKENSRITDSLSKLLYLNNIDLLAHKLGFCMDYIDRIDQSAIGSDGCLDQENTFKFTSDLFLPNFSLHELSLNIKSSDPRDSLSTDKIISLRYKTYQALVEHDIDAFGVFIRDESLQHLLVPSIVDNSNSLVDLSISQLFASACRGFDSGWKGWINCGIFLDLALIKHLKPMR
ncbi:putative type II lanthionine synthetase [Synechococcus sp. BIOS-E4-1]|uniref:DUF4135 domain-containing protein n=1 Tax=Synechococcus sp. BIOS-E4-1 TaxID=1400864 RepID=UPI0016457F7A|nr:DUF4135 domain-containing protein [Synechococcus sp. BIOS-E4-1]QNI54585.1 putative type II lanthionine synthetase [Synechococcus sp. BIOS-E4-1]